jgi:hypothetical protein
MVLPYNSLIDMIVKTVTQEITVNTCAKYMIELLTFRIDKVH